MKKRKKKRKKKTYKANGDRNHDEDEQDVGDEEAHVVHDQGGLANALIEVEDLVSGVGGEVLNQSKKSKIQHPKIETKKRLLTENQNKKIKTQRRGSIIRG